MTQTVTHTVTEAVLIHPPHQYLCDPSSLHIHQEMLRFQINQNQENPKSLLTKYQSLELQNTKKVPLVLIKVIRLEPYNVTIMCGLKKGVINSDGSECGAEKRFHQFRSEKTGLKAEHKACPDEHTQLVFLEYSLLWREDNSVTMIIFLIGLMIILVSTIQALSSCR